MARMMDLEESSGTEDSDSELLENAHVIGNAEQQTRYTRSLNFPPFNEKTLSLQSVLLLVLAILVILNLYKISFPPPIILHPEHTVFSVSFAKCIALNNKYRSVNNEPSYLLYFVARRRTTWSSRS